MGWATLLLFFQLFLVACQAPLSTGCSRQIYWSELPFLPPYSKYAGTLIFLLNMSFFLCLPFIWPPCILDGAFLHFSCDWHLLHSVNLRVYSFHQSRTIFGQCIFKYFIMITPHLPLETPNKHTSVSLKLSHSSLRFFQDFISVKH